MKKPLYFLVALIPMLLMTSCHYLTSPRITVVNDTDVAISNLTITGRAFTNSVPLVQAHSVKSLTVYPRGDSGIALSFDTPQGRISTKEIGYIEAVGCYRVRLVVETNFRVSFFYD